MNGQTMIFKKAGNRKGTKAVLMHDRYHSSSTDKHQSRAVNMPQKSGQRCCENTEPDMSQEPESAGPSACEPSQEDFITLHS